MGRAARNHGGTGGHGCLPMPGERPNFNRHVMSDQDLQYLVTNKDRRKLAKLGEQKSGIQKVSSVKLLGNPVGLPGSQVKLSGVPIQLQGTPVKLQGASVRVSAISVKPLGDQVNMSETQGKLPGIKVKPSVKVPGSPSKRPETKVKQPGTEVQMPAAQVVSEHMPGIQDK